MDKPRKKVPQVDKRYQQVTPSGFWDGFLTAAGFSPTDCAHYTQLFEKHKMTKELLPQLNKEYLYDMGITAIGDVIKILSHVKQAGNVW